jgi:hypothetical protein
VGIAVQEVAPSQARADAMRVQSADAMRVQSASAESNTDKLHKQKLSAERHGDRHTTASRCCSTSGGSSRELLQLQACRHSSPRTALVAAPPLTAPRTGRYLWCPQARPAPAAQAQPSQQAGDNPGTMHCNLSRSPNLPITLPFAKLFRCCLGGAPAGSHLTG